MTRFALEVLNVYLLANLLLVVAALGLGALRMASAASSRPLEARHLLCIGRALMLAVLVLAPVAAFKTGSEFAPLQAQVWSAPTMAASPLEIRHASLISLPAGPKPAWLALDQLATGLLVIAALALGVAAWQLAVQVRTTIRTVRTACLVRCMGSVRLLVSDTACVPFALWAPGRHFVVVPASLLLHPAELRLALRHESQHHRQGDTRLVYATLLGRLLFVFNPASYWFFRQLSELEELACDAAVAQRVGHCTRTYCALLLRVAHAAQPSPQALGSFMANWRKRPLQRRIAAALNPPARSRGAAFAMVPALVALNVLVVAAATVEAPIRDHRLSLPEAQALLVKARSSTQFPLSVNDDVLTQLNLLVATPDGRAFLRDAMGRMRQHAPDIDDALVEQGLPRELAAVPLVESGYRNLPSVGRKGTGAGLWMFIERTAQSYGLEVSSERDERLDVQAETSAAARLFADLHARFDDWPLTLMAYNAGVAQTEAGIRATGSRDAWALHNAGYRNDPHYLARVVAVMLILANPEHLP